MKSMREAINEGYEPTDQEIDIILANAYCNLAENALARQDCNGAQFWIDLAKDATERATTK